MKSPAVAPLDGDEDEEWTEFGDACPCECHTTGESRETSSFQGQGGGTRKQSVFEISFPALRRPLLSVPAKSGPSRKSKDQPFWENLCHCSATPTSVGQNEIILSKFRSTVLARDNVSASLSTTGQRALDLPVDSEPFDWQHKVAAVEPLPTFVRPGKPESPVNINFDHSQAAFGLSQLAVEDLKQMKWEMSDKFRHLSQVLVGELQTRDQLIHSLNVKNTFISSLLKVESIRYHPTEERPASAKYLQSVIPFHPPDKGDWSTPLLQQLTKILDAIAQNSDSVPDLVSSYIQTEVLKE